MGPRPLWPNNCPKGMETCISREIAKDVKSKCLSHVRPNHCAIGTEDTVHQRDFLGGPNLEDHESKVAHSRHLGNTQTGVGQSGPLLDRIEPHLVCGLCTPNLMNIPIHRWPRQGQKLKFQRAAAAVLNCTKSVILVSSIGRMTKSLAAILNFQRVLFRAPVTLVWTAGLCMCRRNLVQIGQKVAEIHLFVYFQDGSYRHLEFYRKLDFGSQCPAYGQCLFSWQIWRKLFIGDWEMSEKQYPRWLPPPYKISNQGYYGPSVIFLHTNLQTKFGASWSKIGRNTPVCVFSRWRSRPSCILPKVGFWAIETLAWPTSIGLPNLMQISLFATEIWPKCKIQDDGQIHLFVYF